MKQGIKPADILFRLALASLGGYYCALLVAASIAIVISEPRAAATIAGIQWGLVIHTAVALAAFAVRSPKRLALILAISAAASLTFINMMGKHFYV